MVTVVGMLACETTIPIKNDTNIIICVDNNNNEHKRKNHQEIQHNKNILRITFTRLCVQFVLAPHLFVNVLQKNYSVHGPRMNS